MKPWSEMTPTEKDILVAEKVMKMTDKQIYRARYVDWPNRYIRKGEELSEWQRTQEFGEWEYCGPSFTTFISNAWQVVEKMNLTVTPGYHCWKAAYCNASGTDRDTEWVGMTNRNRWATAPTAPEAICLAGLRAVGVEVE